MSIVSHLDMVGRINGRFLGESMACPGPPGARAERFKESLAHVFKTRLAPTLAKWGLSCFDYLLEQHIAQKACMVSHS